MTAPKIVMPSQIVMRATASLIGYARNSRTHDERQIDVLCKSITEYGFTNPILIDGDRGVIAGHGRIMAAEKLGLVEVPCIELRHLTNEQKRAYLILDNQSSLMSGWNEALLAQELADLSGVGIEAVDLGFDAAEVDRLMETLGVEFGGKASQQQDARSQLSDALVFSVVVETSSETTQAQLLSRLESEGFKCRLLIS